MIHMYYAIRDKVAKKYIHVCESENNATMARMCNILAQDDKTFLGQAPGDYVAKAVATFDDETGVFTPIEPEKVWEGKPNE